MFVEDALAELPEVLCRRELLVHVWLHEQRKGLARDALGVWCGTDAYTMRGRAQFARGRELKGFTRLESETVGWDRDFGESTTAGADVEAGSRRRRLDDRWFS